MPRRFDRTICAPRTRDLGNIPYVDVMLAGDTHFGDPLADPRYRRFIDRWAHEVPDRYVILTGDLLNCAIKDSKSFSYSEGPVGDAMHEASLFLSSLGDRLLTQVSGNHDQRVMRSVGIDVVAECTPDGMPYDGMESFLTIKVGHNSHCSNRERKPISYDVYVTHGVGGGRTDGAKLNNVGRLREIVTADLYVQGHQHDTVIKPKVVYEWSHDKKAIIERQQLCVVTPGGIMRSDHGMQGYAVAKAYAPCSCEVPVVRFDGAVKGMVPRLVPVS